jgi:molybdate transport system regulatory protein
MSYKRAWALIDDLNQCFGKPVVATQMGGKAGGGSELTSFGRDLVAHYRAIEIKAHKAAALHLQALQAVASGKD